MNNGYATLVANQFFAEENTMYKVFTENDLYAIFHLQKRYTQFCYEINRIFCDIFIGNFFIESIEINRYIIEMQEILIL